jgi:hypothetical protein
MVFSEAATWRVWQKALPSQMASLPLRVTIIKLYSTLYCQNDEKAEKLMGRFWLK